MADNATIRLNKVLRELNISLDRAVDFLGAKGHDVEARPTTKISNEVYQVLLDEFQTDMSKKVASKEVGEEKRKEKEALRQQLEQEQEEKRLAREKKAASEKVVKAKAELSGPKTVGKIDLSPKKKAQEPAAVEETPAKAVEPVKEEKKKEEVVAEKPEVKAEAPVKKAEVEKPVATEKPAEKKVAEKAEKVEEKTAPAEEAEKTPENETLTTQYQKLSGPKITGDKIDLSKFAKPKKKKEVSKAGDSADKKKRRKRIVSTPGQKTGPRQSGTGPRGKNAPGGPRKAPGQRFSQGPKVEPTEEDVQKQVRETLEKLQGKSKKGKGAKYRRDKRDQHRQQTEKDLEQQELQSKILKVTEFVTASEVAVMMDVPTTKIISA